MLVPTRSTIFLLLRRAALWPILAGEKWLSSLGCQAKVERRRKDYFFAFLGVIFGR